MLKNEHLFIKTLKKLTRILKLAEEVWVICVVRLCLSKLLQMEVVFWMNW